MLRTIHFKWCTAPEIESFLKSRFVQYIAESEKKHNNFFHDWSINFCFLIVISSRVVILKSPCPRTKPQLLIGPTPTKIGSEVRTFKRWMTLVRKLEQVFLICCCCCCCCCCCRSAGSIDVHFLWEQQQKKSTTLFSLLVNLVRFFLHWRHGRCRW